MFRLKSFSGTVLVGRRFSYGLHTSPPVDGTQASVPAPSHTVRRPGDISKGLFTRSESDKDQRTIENDQRMNGKYQREISLLLVVNGS